MRLRMRSRRRSAELGERHHFELWRRTAKERPEQEQLVGRFGLPRELGYGGGTEERLHLDARARARRDRARRDDAAVRDRVGATPAVAQIRHEQAHLETPQPLDPIELSLDVLERLDPVAK